MKNLDTYIQEKQAEFGEECIYITPEGTWHVREGYEEKLEEIIRQTARETVEAVVPKKETMQAAIETGSDAGAGHTIGFNSAIDELLAAAKERGIL